MVSEYTPAQQAEHRRKWVEALRSGGFRQGQGALRSRDGRYCCLGVACDLAAAEGVVVVDDDESGYGRDARLVAYVDPATGYKDTAYLPEKVRDWLGLVDERGRLKATAQEGVDRDALSSLNDSGATFERIANIIERDEVMLAAQREHKAAQS